MTLPIHPSFNNSSSKGDFSPRRILMTADTVGGVWTYSVELARAIAPHGVHVALATMGGPLSESQRVDVEQTPNVELFESSYKLEWMEDPWNDVREAGRWLLDLERRLRPDLVHLNGYAHGALPWCAPVLVVGHSCVFSWFSAVRSEAPSTTWEWYRREVKRGLSHADEVTAPTNAMLASLEHLYGPFTTGGAVYNARSCASFRPAEKHPIVFSAGRIWDEAKNIAALANVAPDSPWSIYVAGPSQHPDGSDAQFDRVNLLGNLDTPRLAEWMSRAAIYALPARYEPFGLSALEAGLSGCALILGDIPSLREVWAESAIYVKPGDDAQLLTAIRNLAKNEALRKEMAIRARARALQYTPERMARGYLSVYRRLLRNAFAETGEATDAASGGHSARRV